MKIRSMFLSATALLTLSGCYTQLLVEDVSAPVQKARPVIAIPAPVPVNPMAPDPEILIVSPQPVYVPVNNPEPITSYSNPAGTAQPPSNVQRTSGDQRTSPASPPSNANNSRNSGTTRGRGR